jgi:hypothetical protein
MSHTAAIGSYLPLRGSDVHRIAAGGGTSVTFTTNRALFAQISRDLFAGSEIQNFFTGADLIGYECGTFAECLRGRQVDGGRSDEHCGPVPVNRTGTPVAIGGCPRGGMQAQDARNGLAHNMPGSTAVSLMHTLEGPHANGS